MKTKSYENLVPNRRLFLPGAGNYIASDDACNFAAYSKNGGAVTLQLYTADALSVPAVSLSLDCFTNKSGHIWHCRLTRAQLLGAVYYAYSVAGNADNGLPPYWQAFDPNKILLDPLANEVFFPPAFDPGAACIPGSNAGKAPLGTGEGTELYVMVNTYWKPINFAIA